MKIWILKSKIHRARITDKNLNYEGSLTLDQDYMDRVGLFPYEKVEVYNIANGARFSTYIIPGDRGKGEVVLNGAAARLGEIGDPVIIAAYALVDDSEARDFKPRILRFDDSGNPILN